MEEERLQREEEEKQRKIKEEEEEQLKKAAEEAEKKKKTKKKGKGKKATTAESKELPNLVANTCSDLKSKFLESLKATNDVNNKAPPPERPRGRKIIDNPFEKQLSNNAEIPASVKKRELPAVRDNRLGDIKKRFSQFRP